MGLFNYITSLPVNVQAVITHYATDDLNLDECEQFKNELEQLGYTFEYDFDCVPYDLRKLK